MGYRTDLGETGVFRGTLTSLAFDVLNRVVVIAAPAPWKKGERALFAQQLDAFKHDDLLLFDRGYPA